MGVDLDTAGPVRQGEELDIGRLGPYLLERLPELSGTPEVRQFRQGYSNLTYLLRWGDAEFVLRRPPFGNQVQTAHDMGREFRVLSRLSAVYACAPRPYVYCDDPAILGAPFYVMERRRGLVLRKSLPPDLVLNTTTVRCLCRSLVEGLVRLHAVDYHAAGLDDLGKPAGYAARQVAGWSKRYENARTDEIAGMERIVRWLTDNVPPESRAAVIHNDYKYDNVVLDVQDPTRIVAVLDWEMATLGDPRMDLGTTLGYWVEATDPESLQRVAMGPTNVAGSLSRSELVDCYEELSGHAVPNRLFYYCFGLFKIAVIIQQIYARHVRGHTQDPRFAQLNHMVAVLSEQADRAIMAGRIS